MLSEFDFELTPEDLALIERQEGEFLTQGIHLGAANTSEGASVIKVQQMQAQITSLNSELESIGREKLVKEGEINFLRQKLNQFESEKYETLKKHATKLQLLEQERQALVSHLEREIERLKLESSFQRNQIRTASAKEAPLDTASASSISFSNAFGDLINSGFLKKPRLASNRIDSSCEVSMPSDALNHISTRESNRDPRKSYKDLLFRAIGHADVVFADTESSERDRRLAVNVRNSIQKTLSLTDNIFLALELEYSAVSSCPSNILTFYVGLIIEVLVCQNPEIASLLRDKEITYSLDENIAASLNQRIPDKCSLVSSMCDYFRRIPPGICPSLVHQHLRIFKHLIWRAERVPDCILSLISEGVLKKKLLGFVHFTDKDATFHVRRSDIVLDILQLIDLMTIDSDSRLSMLLVKQIPDASLLNSINDILFNLISRTPANEALNSLSRTFIQLLYRLAASRVLPASVTFEPSNLRLFARRLAHIAHGKDELSIDDRLKSDVIVMFQLLHHVFVVEKAPPVLILIREFVNLWAAVHHFAEDPDVAPYTTHLLPLVQKECDRVIEGIYIPKRDPTTPASD